MNVCRIHFFKHSFTQFYDKINIIKDNDNFVTP